MSGEDDPPKAEDDCVLPPDHPVPSDVIGQYTLDHDPDAEQDIANYVHGQARDEAVQHVELIKTEYAIGEPFQIWDVSTDKDRYWVITNKTNLYSQKHFPTLDYTLSFHIGLMARIHSRELRARGEEPTPFEEVFRRHNQASDALERAIEPEDFQAVGLQLREEMITLIAAMRRRIDLPVDGEPPPAAAVTSWNDLLMDHLCPGEPNKELRQYLKTTCEKTWQLVNWLAHHRHAKKTAAMIALSAVDVFNGHNLWLLMRDRADAAEVCPRCSSRKIRSHFDMGLEADGAFFETCGACSWNNHPGYPARDMPA